MDNINKLNSSLSRFQILISSRSGNFIDQLEQIIKESTDQYAILKRCVTNGHIDPLYDLEKMPDLLILHLSEHWQGELNELVKHSITERPPVLVIGDQENPEMMRQAMKAGARDFLSEPVNNQELIETLQQIEAEKKQIGLNDTGNLTAVINAKGGSGASLIACNLAYLMQASSRQETILMDFDMQFGSLAEYLNLKPENGVSDALKVVDELDHIALNAYMLKHKSGLQILGSTTNSIRLPNQTPEHQINQLLSLLLKNCNQLVVDLPRMIDRTAIAVLQSAGRIVLVVQQDLINIKDAIHMINILRNELAILDDQIIVAINRYDKNSDISIKDIEESLNTKQIVTIPNDYRTAMDSLNKGEPINTVSKRSAINKALDELQAHLVKQDELHPDKGLLNNLFSRLTGG
ncbi:AAA family ATPase [Amphritea balenae]|uniref:Response regulator n=1 Tax=Amphritea balenae TaxID=452629 RepID=A0A3P1SVD3_9GAMM|nr:P-loop NTPase [Amphritea balenae]RRD01182.1 response regulator [Amphritea balenae]GGK59247.1 Flp pilus assembly protein [Amphritea balenae]